MIRFLLSTLALWKSQFTSAGTLVALVVTGYCGHATHWSLPHWSATEEEASAGVHGKSPASSRVGPGVSQEGDLVTFPGIDGVGGSEIPCAKIERRPMTAHVLANGTIQYNQLHVARLSSRVAGVVWRVEKPWGAAVKKGDVLAIVEAPEVGKLKSEFMQQLVQKELRAEVVQRLESAGSAIPERQVREAKFSLREAKLKLLNAQQMLVNLGLAIPIDDVHDLPDEMLRKRIQFLGLPPAMAAKLDASSTTSSLLPIIAPFDGVVVGRDLGVGESVAPQEELFEIADVRTMWVNLDVRSEDAARVSLGDKVVFRAGGVDRQLTGKILWMSTEADRETRTVQVRAELENPILETDSKGFEHRLLRAETFGTGSITVHEIEQAVVVPNSCLHRDDQGLFVFAKVSRQAFRVHRVQAGIVGEEFTEIHCDLTTGTLLAANGSHVLKSARLLSRVEGNGK